MQPQMHPHRFSTARTQLTGLERRVLQQATQNSNTPSRPPDWVCVGEECAGRHSLRKPVCRDSMALLHTETYSVKSHATENRTRQGAPAVGWRAKAVWSMASKGRTAPTSGVSGMGLAWVYDGLWAGQSVWRRLFVPCPAISNALVGLCDASTANSAGNGGACEMLPVIRLTVRNGRTGATRRPAVQMLKMMRMLEIPPPAAAVSNKLGCRLVFVEADFLARLNGLPRTYAT
ncbi:hypothetical protein BKA80DRAFT_117984 [Phyllosticta citrichinensis]